MTALTITYLPADNPAHLYCHDAGKMQPCHLALDLSTGELTADYNPEVDADQGPKIPQAVWDSRTLWWTIPCLTSRAANELLDDIRPLAERVLAGSKIVEGWDRLIGELDEDANAAQDELTAILDSVAADPFSECVAAIDAADWFVDGIDAIGLTADSSDEDIARIAKDEAVSATVCDSGYGILLGAEEYLRERREELGEQDTRPAQAVHLPEWTTGSDKQKVWATGIRANVVAWVQTAIDLYSRPRPDDHPLAGDPETVEQDAKIAAELPIARDRVLAEHRDPGWWIDGQEARGIAAVILPVSRKTGGRLSFIAARVKRARRGEVSA
jgi:hypothetical protein